MNGPSLPLTVKLPDYINQPEFKGCNLNPVVVLTDFKKSLAPSSSSSCNQPHEKTPPIGRNWKKKNYNKPFNVTNPPPKSSTDSLSRPPQIKSGKRKRESWDPSVEYEIEEIVGYHRDKRKKMWYLIKWKNWSRDHNTFEPIENLTGCHYELMKYFEMSRPSVKEIKKKNLEIRMALKERGLLKMLTEKKWKGDDFEKVCRKCPEAAQVFQMNTPRLLELKRRIQTEYMYIVRCLIGMYSHEDPGLLLRGENYKFLLILIQMRLKQLKTFALVQNSINSLEKREIIIENEVDLEDFPDIRYIEKLVPGAGVELSKDPLFGCDCPGGCTPHSRCCGVTKDSVFAYKECGTLRTSERIAIYECNSRCSCPPSCPNRVVQRGAQVKLCLFKTKLCGWGVKALEKIPKGTFVCEYVGELIPDTEAVVRDVNYYSQNKSGYLFDLDFFTDDMLDMYCIDATEQGNVARFINHSCDPNLVVYPVWIDEIEPNKHRLAFFARKTIQENEEIQFDYENLENFTSGQRKNKSHGVRMLSNVRCQCKASKCREWVFGNK